MTVLLLVASLGLGGPQAPVTPARPTSTAVHAPRRSAKAIAAASFALLVAAGGLLHRRLGARAQAEEAEALLDAEFARLEETEGASNSESGSLR